MAGKKGAEIAVETLQMKSTEFCILGTAPLLYNSMNHHVLAEQIYPDRKMSRSEKATTERHDPYAEVVRSVYKRDQGVTGPTRLTLPTRMFKAAMVEAIGTTGGGFKKHINQLVRVEPEFTDIYGTPLMHIAAVRLPNGAPDARVRAIVPNWYCKIRVRFMVPQMTQHTITSILANAGHLNGVGDYRPQKGVGSFGTFELVNSTDKRIKSLLKQGMKVQDAALANPICYDDSSRALLEHYDEMAKTLKLKKRISNGARRQLELQ